MFNFLGNNNENGFWISNKRWIRVKLSKMFKYSMFFFCFGLSFIPRRMMYMQIYSNLILVNEHWTTNQSLPSCVKCYVLCVNRTHCFDWISSMCDSQVPYQKEFINNNKFIWKSIFVTCFSSCWCFIFLLTFYWVLFWMSNTFSSRNAP